MPEMNGIAHIQLTVNDPERCIPFWERLCHFLEMKTLIKGEGVIYCIGSRTGILVRGAATEKRDRRFDQERAGLHHFCFRARNREDVDAVHRFLARTPARMIGVWLPDAVGDRRPQNLPGTWDQYPNWRLPVADAFGTPISLEQLAVTPRLHALVEAATCAFAQR